MFIPQNIRAILWMLGAMASLLSVSVFAKFLSAEYNTFEIMFYRSIFGFFAFLLILLTTKQLRSVRLGHFKQHFIRNIIHFTAQNLWFYALAVLPLSVVIAFEFTTPAWVIVIAAILLGEGFGFRRFVVIVLSLIGVYIITGPSNLPFNFALLSAILCAVGFALTIIATKYLTKVQSVNEILLMMTLMQGIFAGIIILWVGELQPLIMDMVPWLVLIGIFGTLSHYCMANALNLADASIVSPIDLIRLPLSILLGFVLFGEKIAAIVILGTAFLILANYINIIRKKDNA